MNTKSEYSITGIIALVASLFFVSQVSTASSSNSSLSLSSAGANIAAVGTVRDLISSGQARFHIVGRTVYSERTEVEVVLTDSKGQSIGGYAPPFLQSEDDSRHLWKDFVTGNLTVAAAPKQISVREHRKSEDESFAVGFALDHSLSMTVPRALRMQKAIMSALQAFNPHDYVSIVKFTSRVNQEVPLTKNPGEYLEKFKINGLNLHSDGTAIYDAAVESMNQLIKAENVSNRILVLFTDGEDNSSSASLQDVIDLAKEHRIRVHSVVYGITTDGPMAKIAEETGGKLYRLTEASSFDRVFLGIYTALRHSYIITINLKGERVVESALGGVMTAAGVSTGTIRSNEMLVLLPRQNSDISPLSTEETLVFNMDFSFDEETGEIKREDIKRLDSVATVLVQRSDIVLDLLSPSVGQIRPTQQEVELATRKIKSIRDLLISRGINPARIQGYADRSAAANPLLQRVASNSRTTLVFTKL